MQVYVRDNDVAAAQAQAAAGGSISRAEAAASVRETLGAKGSRGRRIRAAAAQGAAQTPGPRGLLEPEFGT